MRRLIDASDADVATELLALAFLDDPTWGWAFPDQETRLANYRRWWSVFVHSAMAHGEVWMAPDEAAAAVWIPPGQAELSDDDEAKLEPLLRELVGEHADDVLVLLDRFEASHPHDAPHYYLSLLGTHPDHRGHGKGIGLLKANLARIDEQGLPVYLESSNPVNDHRYERLGFVKIGEFSAPAGGPTVASMWREAR